MALDLEHLHDELLQLKWERDTAIQQLKELGYGLGEEPRLANWEIYTISLVDGEDIRCSWCKGIEANLNWKWCPLCGARIVGEVERVE